MPKPELKPKGNFNRPKLEKHKNRVGILEYYKDKLDAWTLSEPIALMSDPYFLDEEYDGRYVSFKGEVLDLMDFKPFERAIDSGTLKVDGYNKDSVSEYKPDEDDSSHDRKINRWETCFADLKVKPFEFLEFVKEKKLFTIPLELEFIKTKTKSGDEQYSWASDNYKNDPIKPEINEENEGNPPIEKIHPGNIVQINLESDKVSEEFKIAIQAWQAMYIDKTAFNEQHGHIKNIEKWLMQNHNDLTKAPRQRIAKLINIRKSGGAIKQI